MSKIPSKLPPPSPAKTVVFRQRSTPIGSQPINPSVRNSLNNSLKIGDRVTANGKSGTVAFIGLTKFADGLIKFNCLFLY